MKWLKNILLAVLMLSANCLYAQDSQITCNDYEITIHGSSNLHDWIETAEKVTGQGSIVRNIDGSFDVKALTISIDVLSIKSTEGGIMNSKTYQALKAGKYPVIVFSLVTPVRSISHSMEGSILKASGSLTVAGVTKPIDIRIKIFSEEQGRITVEGMQEINMNDYGIDPPTALMGMLKVKNIIRIQFKAGFSANNI